MKETKMTSDAPDLRQKALKAQEEIQVEEEARQVRERLIELDRRLKQIQGYR
jgi:hypothetical protein